MAVMPRRSVKIMKKGNKPRRFKIGYAPRPPLPSYKQDRFIKKTREIIDCFKSGQYSLESGFDLLTAAEMWEVECKWLRSDCAERVPVQTLIEME